MIRHGQAPFLECSSRGERRLSAFAARVRRRGNRSIEELYQAAKTFADGSTGLSWREAKGRKPVNLAETRILYAALWDDYMAENPALLRVIAEASGLQDTFGQPGHCCQATELWRIRSIALRTPAATLSPPPARVRRVLNKRTDRIPADAIYCGRPSPFGNPFVLGRDGDRDDVCDKFAAWLPTQPTLLAMLPDLAGRDLVCWCAPLRCHCDTLIRLANPGLACS